MLDNNFATSQLRNFASIFVFCLLSLCGRESNSQDSPSVDTGADVLRGFSKIPAITLSDVEVLVPPQQKVENVVLRLGELWCDTQYKFDLALLNESAGDYVISKATTSCGCFYGASESQIIPAGSKAHHKISFKTSKTDFEQSLTLHFVGLDAPVRLIFVGECSERISISPRVARFSAKASAVARFSIPVSEGKLSSIKLKSNSVEFAKIKTEKRVNDQEIEIEFVPSSTSERWNSVVSQDFVASIESNGETSLTNCCLSFERDSATRTIPVRPRFLSRQDGAISSTFVLVRGNDLDEQKFGLLGNKDISLVRPEGSPIAAECYVRGESNARKVITLNLPQDLKQSLTNVQLRLSVGEEVLFFPVVFEE